MGAVAGRGSLVVGRHGAVAPTRWLVRIDGEEVEGGPPWSVVAGTRRVVVDFAYEVGPAALSGSVGFEVDVPAGGIVRIGDPTPAVSPLASALTSRLRAATTAAEAVDGHAGRADTVR